MPVAQQWLTLMTACAMAFASTMQESRWTATTPTLLRRMASSSSASETATARTVRRPPHQTLVGGREPRVKVAGMVTMSNGKIVKYDSESGHFKANDLSMPEPNKAFSQLPESAFHRNFNKNMDRR